MPRKFLFFRTVKSNIVFHGRMAHNVRNLRLVVHPPSKLPKRAGNGGQYEWIRLRTLGIQSGSGDAHHLQNNCQQMALAAAGDAVVVGCG